jgi:nucleotide-binding universal stress UspA family protein
MKSPQKPRTKPLVGRQSPPAAGGPQPPRPAQTATAASLRLQRILVPLDFSGPSVEALRFALPLARQSGARIDLLHVVAPFVVPLEASDFHGKWDQYQARQERQALARLRRLAAVKLDRPLRGDVLVREGSPAAVITAMAHERDSDLLVLSTQGITGLKRFLLGSTVEAVVRRAPCPALTVRPRGTMLGGATPFADTGRIRRILVPVDFSDRSRSLIQYAAAFARRFEAALVLLHVVDHIDVPARVAYMATGLQMVVLERGIRQLQELAQRSLPQHIQAERLVRVGRPYDVIRHVASLERIDLIIIATRTHGGLQRFLMGSTAARVVRHAPCPVLVLR